jgi:hypothetical protein
MPGVRIGCGLGRGHPVTGVGVDGRRSLSLTLSGRLDRRGLMLMILGVRCSCGQQQRGEGGQKADHDAAPSRGRTVTTLNMPACMCISI